MMDYREKKRHTKAFGLLKYIIPILVVTLFLFAARPAHAQDAVVRCQPPTISGDVGETIFLDLYIEDVTGLYAVDLEIDFNPVIATVLDVDNFTPGVQIQPLSSFLVPGLVLFRSADNGTGEIHYAATQFLPSPPVSGSGSLARVYFEGQQTGSFTMNYFRNDLSDINGGSIASTTDPCQVNINIPTAIALSQAAANESESGVAGLFAALVALMGLLTGMVLFLTRSPRHLTGR